MVRTGSLQLLHFYLYYISFVKLVSCILYQFYDKICNALCSLCTEEIYMFNGLCRGNGTWIILGWHREVIWDIHWAVGAAQSQCHRFIQGVTWKKLLENFRIIVLNIEEATFDHGTKKVSLFFQLNWYRRHCSRSDIQ